jgi:acetylornithine/LysW-gamma-L-lysine aminotransferase
VVDVTADHPDDVAATEEQHTSGGVARRPVTIVRGKGAKIWDDRGNEYIDCASAHGWANIGHCHPEIVAAIHKQAGQLVAMTESGYNDQRAIWYDTLAQVLESHFGDTERGTLSRIFPCNSGTEAVEAAMKFARFRTQRTDFVAFHRGFHGRTFGSLSVTSARRYRAPFEPLLTGATHLHLNDLNALDSAVTDNTAGVILEIIQGEGGVHEASTDFIAGVQHICRDRGALFIVDEIQTGFGRTGRWLARRCGGRSLASSTPVCMAARSVARLSRARPVWRACACSSAMRFRSGPPNWGTDCLIL